jgi:hypothetical protein
MGTGSVLQRALVRVAALVIFVGTLVLIAVVFAVAVPIALVVLAGTVLWVLLLFARVWAVDRWRRWRGGGRDDGTGRQNVRVRGPGSSE